VRSAAITVVPPARKASRADPPRSVQSRIASATIATGLTLPCNAKIFALPRRHLGELSVAPGHSAFSLSPYSVGNGPHGGPRRGRLAGRRFSTLYVRVSVKKPSRRVPRPSAAAGLRPKYRGAARPKADFLPEERSHRLSCGRAAPAGSGKNTSFSGILGRLSSSEVIRRSSRRHESVPRDLNRPAERKVLTAGPHQLFSQGRASSVTCYRPSIMRRRPGADSCDRGTRWGRRSSDSRQAAAGVPTDPRCPGDRRSPEHYYRRADAAGRSCTI